MFGSCVLKVEPIDLLTLFGINPATMLFCFVISLWGARRLSRNGVSYKKFSKLIVFADAVLILGVIYLLADLMWLSFNAFKWVYTYPEMIAAYSLIYPRNLLALFLLAVFLGSMYGKYFSFTRYTLSCYFAYGIFLFFWFYLAPNPAFTDWAYAVRNNYDLSTIVFSFVISNVFAKVFFAFTYHSVLGVMSK